MRTAIIVIIVVLLIIPLQLIFPFPYGFVALLLIIFAIVLARKKRKLSTIPASQIDDTMFYGCPKCGRNTEIISGRQYCAVCRTYY